MTCHAAMPGQDIVTNCHCDTVPAYILLKCRCVPHGNFCSLIRDDIPSYKVPRKAENAKFIPFHWYFTRHCCRASHLQAMKI